MLAYVVSMVEKKKKKKRDFLLPPRTPHGMGSGPALPLTAGTELADSTDPPTLRKPQAARGENGSRVAGRKHREVALSQPRGGGLFATFCEKTGYPLKRNPSPLVGRSICSAKGGKKTH